MHGDSRGNLIALERQQSLPFALKRLFYIFAVPDEAVRARHATSAEMMMIAVSGSFAIAFDNGREQAALRLDTPDRGVHVMPGVVVTTSAFSPGAVLLVLSSLAYSEVVYSPTPFFREPGA